MKHFFPTCRLLVVILASLPVVEAAEFSTSFLQPTALPLEGIITAAFPSGNARIAYYFSVDVQKGELVTQLTFTGPSGGEKRVELALLDNNAELVTGYWIQGAASRKDAVRGFPIDRPGPQLLRVTVLGPEADTYRVQIGGRAFVSPSSSPARQ